MNIKGKHFYKTTDFTQKDILGLIDLAIAIKKGKHVSKLSNKTLALLFFNPSLRTRMSFMVGMYKLGGQAIDLPIKAGGAYTFEFNKGVVMDKDKIEHVKEAAQVLSKYCDAIAIRASELITSGSESVEVQGWEVLKQDKIFQAFMKYATVPIINMESNVYHPCQGLGDALTIREKLKQTKGKKYVLTWAYHPKALPMATPNSEILAACNLGMNVVVAHPKGWELDKEIISTMKQKVTAAGGSLTMTNSMDKAFKGADVVCAKSWGALQYYGNWSKEKRSRDELKHWIVDEEKMKLTNKALFMHCLPVRRNVVVADKVIDSSQSIVVDQAENRMWAQMALLSEIVK